MMMVEQLEKLEVLTLPHRKVIGWVSLVGGLTMAMLLAFVAHTVNNNRLVVEDNNRQNAEMNESVSQLLAIQQKFVLVSVRATMPTGEGVSVLNWPGDLEELLGWTSADIQEGGLQLLTPRQKSADGIMGVLKPIYDSGEGWGMPQPAIARAKDGSEVEVTVEAWARKNGEQTLVNAVIKPIE